MDVGHQLDLPALQLRYGIHARELKTPTGVGNMAGSLSKPCSIVSSSPSLSILYSALTVS